MSKLIPTPEEIDESHASGAEAATLCANWREGCNGETDGPRCGRLTLCDECDEET